MSSPLTSELYVEIALYGPNVRIELTRRNLEVLLAKLDDPNSSRTIERAGGDVFVSVVAVENELHYSDRRPGPMVMNGKVI